MRILFLSVSAELGGSEVVLVELLRGLRRLHPDWRLIVVVPREGPLVARVQDAGAEAHVVPMPDAILRLGESGAASAAGFATRVFAAAGAVRAYSRALGEEFARERPDVIHSNGFKAHLLAARTRPAQTPVLWHMHEYVSARVVSRRLLKLYCRAVDLIVTNSSSVAADVRRALGPGLSLRTIHNAVDLETFSPAGPKADLDALAAMEPVPPGTLRIGLVATFSRWKGHEVFMRALQRLGPAAPVRAYIVGGSVYDTGGSQYSTEELRRIARSLGVQDKIAFTGVVHEMAPVMRALDIVVHASTQPEPFGLVIAETMACGRALIVSAAGGAAEIVRPEHDALVHSPGSADELASALSRLIADATLRAQIGANGRESAVTRFDSARFAREFDAAYASILPRPVVHQ